MRRTDNDAITMLLLPEKLLPILLPCRGQKAEGEIFYCHRDVHGQKHVTGLAVVTASGREGHGNLEQSPAEFHSRLKYLVALDRRAQAMDRKAIKGVLADGIRKGFHTWESLFDPARLFGATLNTGLHRIMFVVWWSNKHKKLVPGLYCPNRQTEQYALALSLLGTPGLIGICPNCGKFFYRRKTDHVYDSSRCRSAAGMRRFRAEPRNGKKEVQPARKPR